MIRFLISLWFGGLALASLFWIGVALRDFRKSPIWRTVCALGFAWFGLEMAAIALHIEGPLAKLVVGSN
jgi:hypothetical protein